MIAEGAAAYGKTLRRKTPRSAHAMWATPANRPDPIALLEASSVGRLANLVPVRYARMTKSMFAFLRGFPAMMAHDFGVATPVSSLRVQTCGDCHVENFGIFATPERNVIFDINDFDETLPAPFEWDVKRLAASVHIAGRANSFSEKQCSRAVRETMKAYRREMRSCAEMTALQVWYSRIDATDVLEQVRNIEIRRAKAMNSAPDDTHELVAEQYTEGEGLSTRIADKPPKLFHPPPDREVIDDAHSVFARYRLSLRDDLQVLFNSYKLTDLAVKVVGLGSVGTRCAVALLMANANDALILQIKEARPSILEPYAGATSYSNQGQRVVAGQLLMQVASDIFLGWSDSDDGHHFYIRQISDVKGSADVSAMTPAELTTYGAICGKTLAVAHARSGTSAQLTGYLGSSSAFDRAIVSFAAAYADQVEADYGVFMNAVKTGRLSVDGQKGS